MIATIKIHDLVVTFDGLDWSGDEILVKYCRFLADGLPFAYYPDPMRGVAKAVANQIPQCTVKLSGKPAPKPKGEGQIIY